MSNSDYCRKKAEAAKAMAERVSDVQAKRVWLEVAEHWLRMIPKDDRTAEQRFDQAEHDQGTGQERSGSHH
jgi:hypothetical protein